MRYKILSVCAALAAVVPLAFFGAWMAHAGLLVIPLMMVAGLVLVAWRLHHQPAKATGCETRTHQEGAEP